MRHLRSAGAAFALTLLIVGPPLVIRRWGRWDGLVAVVRDPHTLLARDDGRVIIGVLCVIGLLCWLIATIAVVVELAALRRLRRQGRAVTRENLAGSARGVLTWPRRLVRPLVLGLASAAIAMGSVTTMAPVSQAYGVGPVIVGTYRPGAYDGARPGAAEVWSRPADHGPEARVAPATAEADWRSTPERPVVAHDDEAETRTYVVAPGDSLWAIAERELGDGQRWPEITELNGLTSDLLQVGWTLKLPSADAETVQHQVERSETLWQIADDELGDPQLWPTIPPLNPQITNPDHIEAGWDLRLPAEAKTGSGHGAGATVPDSAPTVNGTDRPTAAGPSSSATTAPTSTNPAGDGPGSVNAPGTTAPPGTKPAGDGSDSTYVPGTTAPPRGTSPSPPPAGMTPPGSNADGSTPAVTTPPPTTSSPPATSPPPATSTDPSDAATASATPSSPAAPAAPAAPATPETPVIDAESSNRTAVWTVTALGGLLAAGVIALLRRRRAAQLAARPEGRRIPHPGAASQQRETDIGVIADRDALAVRSIVADGNAPAYSGVGRIIVISDDSVAVLDRRGSPRPWVGADPDSEPQPAALVTLGRDPSGSVIVADLEQPGPFVVEGTEPVTVVRALLGIALNLACEEWSQGVDLLVVGEVPEGMFDGFDRVDVIPDLATGWQQLIDLAEERRAHLADAPGTETPATLATMRADPDLAEAWNPIVVVFLDPAPPEARHHIVDLMRGPSCGVTAVIGAQAPGTVPGEDVLARQTVLTVRSDGTGSLQPAGLDVSPSLVDADEALVDLLQTTASFDTEPAWWSIAGAGDNQGTGFDAEEPEPPYFPGDPASASSPSDTRAELDAARPSPRAPFSSPPYSPGNPATASPSPAPRESSRADSSSPYFPGDPATASSPSDTRAGSCASSSSPYDLTGAWLADIGDTPARDAPPTSPAPPGAGDQDSAEPLTWESFAASLAGYDEPSAADPWTRSLDTDQATSGAAAPRRALPETPQGSSDAETREGARVEPSFLRSWAAPPQDDHANPGLYDIFRAPPGGRPPGFVNAATSAERFDRPGPRPSPPPPPPTAAETTMTHGIIPFPAPAGSGAGLVPPSRTTPTLLLLGPIMVTGVRGNPPPRAEHSCLEYLAWILEHPHATPREMSRGLGVAEGTRRSNMSRLRGWLGQADDGRPYLPEAYSGRIRLDDAVSSDWFQLCVLVHGGVENAPTERLSRALTLVRGAPLADAAPGQWHWAEEMRTDMISVIRDVGLQLGRRLLASRDIAEARWAIGQALLAAPGDELLLALKIQIESAAGNHTEVERLATSIIRDARLRRVDLNRGTIAVLQRAIEGSLRAGAMAA